MKLDTLKDAKTEMKKRIGETEYYFAITLKDGDKVIGEINAYPEAGEPLGKALGLDAEVAVGVALAAVHELVGKAVGIVGRRPVEDLVQGHAGVLAVAVPAPCFIWTLVLFAHFQWVTNPSLCFPTRPRVS